MQTPAERARSALPTHLIQSAPARAPLSKHTPRARLHTQKCFEKLAEHAPRARAERADRTFQSPPCKRSECRTMHGLRRSPSIVSRAQSRQASGGEEEDKRKTTAGQEDGQQQDKRRTREGQERRTTAGQGQAWSARPEDNGRTSGGPSHRVEGRGQEDDKTEFRGAAKRRTRGGTQSPAPFFLR